MHCPSDIWGTGGWSGWDVGGAWAERREPGAG